MSGAEIKEKIITDFPSIKVGKNYKVSKDAFEKWASEKRV